MAGKPRDLKRPKTVHISTRFDADLRKRLERAAKAAGRSLSDEISRRLESSFSAPTTNTLVRKVIMDGDVAAMIFLIKTRKGWEP